MSKFTDPHASDLGEVFAVAESIESWNGRGLPKGVEPRFWRAIDRLKHDGAPAALVMLAERMGLHIFQLHRGLLMVSSEEELATRKRELAKLEREWLGHLPLGLAAELAYCEDS